MKKHITDTKTESLIRFVGTIICQIVLYLLKKKYLSMCGENDINSS